MSLGPIDHIRELDHLCRARGLTIGLAESCTAGLLSSWLGAYPGVSSWYQGAVVSYSRAVKRKVLGVPHRLLLAHGEVSLPVARAMAVGAQHALGCDWAISITGIAGPSGGSPTKPVGTVCFGLVGPGLERVVQKAFSPQATRVEIQRLAAEYALDLLVRGLRSEPGN